MSYGLKYRLLFDSVSGSVHEIKILESGYTGVVELRSLGNAPILKMDDNDAVHGTSLEVNIETKFEGDLKEFYTVDSKKFRVEVWREDVLFWVGYVLPELYSEPYISAPCDISVTASDGLGILKNIDFELSGEYSIFEIISYCCSQTGLQLNYVFASSLYANGMEETEVMYTQTLLCCDTFAEENCYEVLEKILISLGAYIKQKDGKWYILRYTDQDVDFLEYNSLGERISSFTPSILTLGSIGDDTYPIGQLESEIVPAKKDFILEQSYDLYPSFLKNYDFSSEEGWDITSGVRFMNINDETYCEIKPAEKGKSINQISQQIDVEATKQPFKIEFQFSVCFYSSRDVGSVEMNTDRLFQLIIIMTQANGTKYYLSREGWKTDESVIDIQGTVQNGDIYKTDRTHYNFVPSSYETFRINFNELPYSGKLSVCIKNPYVYKPYNQPSGGVALGDWENLNLIGIKKFIITNNVDGNPDINVLLNPKASTSANSINISFLDTPFPENAQKVFKNILRTTNGFTSEWHCRGSENDSFVNIALQDISSRIGRPLFNLKGTIQKADFDLLLDKYSGKKLYLKEYSHDLLEEEIDCTLCEFVLFDAGCEGEITQSPRSSNKSKTQTRVSGEKEYRSYGGTSSSPKMIRELETIQDGNLSEDCFLEIDSGNSSTSKKVAINKLIDLFADTFWTKEVLEYLNGYLIVLKKKIKAGDSDLWNTHMFDDFLDQPVRKTDSVQFKQVTTNKVITDEITSDQFVSGPLGEGYRINENGEAEFQNLTVRGTFSVFDLLIQQIRAVGGQLLVSSASIKTSLVEETPSGYKCFFNTENGKIPNPFIAGDQAIHQIFTGNSINRYWRLVTEIGTDYFLLSKTDCEAGSGIPSAGDEIMLLGNRTDKSRQGAILISAYGNNTPFVAYYAGINSFSLSGKEIMREGNLNGIVDEDFGQLQGFGVYIQKAYIKGILRLMSGKTVEEAVGDVQSNLDNLQIGSQNLISKKMMLKWNEKNKDIAVWGQDEDGIYLDVAPKLLFNNITTEAYNPVFDIKFKVNTQYVLSVEWKHKSPNPDNTGLAFYIGYDDGTRSNVFLTKDIKTKTITNVISEAGKTISKIYNGYGNGDINALIYDISLIEGNKPLQGFPVAAEDQIGANNVNLADGTKGPFTVEGGTNAYAYKALYMPVIKPNTVYYVNAQNIEFLSGNISKCDFVLFDKAIKNYLTTTYHHLYDKNGGILITKNDFEAQEGYLLCYAGEAAHTAGNSVRFTEVMLVEGFFPAPVWSPSHGDVEQSIQDAITKTVDITAPSQVFKYGAGYTGTPTPASIVLTALSRNFTPASYQWQYLNGSTWMNISEATASTYSVTPGNTTLFPSGTNVRTFRVVCNGDEKLSDNFTLAKLADGAQGAAGKDAYTVLLTNESHAFAGSVSAALAGSTSCTLAAYKGATQVAATIGSISGLPTGMTVSIANNGTTKATITFTVTTSMTTASGTVNIPVTVDGKSFTRVFSYSIAFKGATGAQGAKGDKGDTGAQGIPGESINGKMLYKDPEFKLGLNGTKTYGAQNGGSVTVSRIQKSSNANAAGSPYNDSDYCLYIKAYGGTSTNHLGGFSFAHMSRANAVFIVKVSAKIPVGYALRNIHNNFGTGSRQEQLTSMAGTGKYETYIFKVTCGNTGSFSTINYLTLTGPLKTESDPLEWFVDYATVFDQTADGYSDIEITTKDSFAAQLGFTDFEALEKNAVNSENGTLIQGGYINTNLIKADALIAIDGFIDKLKTNIFAANSIKANMLSVAGFNFADYKIYGGAAYGSGSGIQITSTTAERSFKAYKDTNNYIGMYYNSATDWGIKGVIGGATYLQLGNINKIGGFEIGSTYIQNNGLKLSSGSIEYKKDKLQSNFGALYTGITGIATGLYIKNTAISTMNRHELCAYFQGSIGDLKINSSGAMIETANVSSNHYALYIPSGQVYMNANRGGIFFKNVQNVNGKSNYYLCIDRSTGQLYYR